MKAHTFSRRPFQFTYMRASYTHFKETYHAHQGMEFCIIHEGKGRLILNQEIIKLQSGMILYFQPFQLHRVQMNVSKHTPFIRSIIIFEPSEMIQYLKSFPYLLSFFKSLWEDELPTQVIREFHKLDLFLKFLQSIHTQLNSIEPERIREEYSLFLISFLQQFRTMWENGTNKYERKQREFHHAERMMRWIEKHYTEDFQLDRLANELHLSKYHVSHLFKNSTGSTLTEYITARRIRQACWLLNTTTLTIKEIGFKVGFSNSAYFTKKFRENVGVTPKDYRKHRYSNHSNPLLLNHPIT